MPVIVEWREKSFAIEPSQMTAVKDFTLKRSVKTQEHTDDGKIYKNRENAEAGVITLSASINARLGVDVNVEIQDWLAKTVDGGRGLLLVGGVDYLGDEVMLTNCDITKVQMQGNIITQCDIKLSFTSSKEKPAPPAASSSSKKKSSKKKTSGGSGDELYGPPTSLYVNNAKRAGIIK